MNFLDLIKDETSLVPIAVGTAEGTRTPDGKFTQAYWGHADPGNGKCNLGSFSYQGLEVDSPKAADAAQLKKLRGQLLSEFNWHFPSDLFKASEMLVPFVTACDVFTQSEAACLFKGGFMERASRFLNLSTAQLIDSRVKSYYDPKTEKLDAPGFGNNLARLHADQTRRQGCLELAIAHYLKQKGSTP